VNPLKKEREALDNEKVKELFNQMHFEKFTFSEEDPLLASPGSNLLNSLEDCLVLKS